jgi:Zn-dependent oligopeptidase
MFDVADPAAAAATGGISVCPQLAQKAYGITIVKAVNDGDNKPHVWHKDVTLYQVYNQGTQQPIAYFWTDLYARPGSKSGAAGG